MTKRIERENYHKEENMPSINQAGVVFEYTDSDETCEGNHPKAMENALRYYLRDGGVTGSIRVPCTTGEHRAILNFVQTTHGPSFSARIESES